MIYGKSPAKAKRISNLVHSLDRLWYRYGIRMDLPGIEALCQQIKGSAPHTRMLRPDQRYGNRMLVAALYNGAWLPFIWDDSTASVVTCLPFEALIGYTRLLLDMQQKLLEAQAPCETSP